MRYSISIIVATYNAERTLERCIKSIVPQLGENTELIVIDGGSSDNTLTIIDKFRESIAYSVSEADDGIYDAWNKGIKNSNGDWIMFVGADDQLEVGALDVYDQYLTEHNGALDFISGRVRYVDSEGRILSISGKQWRYNEGRYSMGVTHVASITNRNYLKKVNGFDIRYKFVGDYHLLLKGGKDLRTGFVDRIIATMETGGASFSVKALKEQLKVKLEARDIPRWLCYLIYAQQLIIFKTYNLRHRL